MKPIVEVEHLRMVYGSTVAVHDVSFQVAGCEVFGLPGANGAGKTTTAECPQGLRRRWTGRLRVLGLDPGAQQAASRSRIGL